MENPRAATTAGHGGVASAWRREQRSFTPIRFRAPHRPAPIRDILAAAADARRCGDHAAADMLENVALVTLRQQLRSAAA
jgi:hypothetical protein